MLIFVQPDLFVDPDLVKSFRKRDLKKKDNKKTNKTTSPILHHDRVV